MARSLLMSGAMFGSLGRITILSSVLAALLGAVSSCGSESDPSGSSRPKPVDTDPARVRERLEATLGDLADMGAKICGTSAGESAGKYVSDRFRKAGLKPEFESFSFLSYELASSSVSVMVDGAAVPMEHRAFHYSGGGSVDADVVDIGKGHETDYAGKDVTGKIALVTRDPSFHRQAQYQLLADHGGAAMLYVSQAPENLIQIGTIADPEDGLAKIPTVSVGKDDGTKIIDALAQGKKVHATISVDAKVVPATGRNVVARFPGTDPSGAYVVVGAHYDTWHVGSTDNGTGVASLLELADEIAPGPNRRLGLIFVGYDGEELGLFGGYDFLRKHVVMANEPMLAFINLEMPGAGASGSGLRAIAHTNTPLDESAKQVEIDKLYTTYVGMQLVPALFGGLIPTDIQGMYWSGLPGLTTYCETPYYHTTADTPDKVDTGFLADATLGLAKLLAAVDEAPIASFDADDPEVWRLELSTTPQGSGDLDVAVTAKDSTGAPQSDAPVRLWIDVDDFSRVADLRAKTDAAGKATFTVPNGAVSSGSGARFLHATAGKSYPLVERIVSLP